MSSPTGAPNSDWQPSLFLRVRELVALRRTAILAMGLALGFAPGPAFAATVSWQTVQGISGEGDVDTTGSLLYAYNFGSNTPDATEAVATTINGVAFAPAALSSITAGPVTFGNVTLRETEPGWVLIANISTGVPTQNPYAALSSSYRNLLGTAIFATAPGTMQVDLGGLTVGQSYRIQLWSSFADHSGYGSFFGSASVTGGSSSTTLDSNVGNADGAVGQWVIGTFTAAATMERLELNGLNNSYPLLNGLQVRVVAAAVPEPASTGLLLTLGFGSVALGVCAHVRRRLRSRKARIEASIVTPDAGHRTGFWTSVRFGFPS